MESIAGHYFASGEINQRRLELPNLDPGGPAAMANTILFEDSLCAPRQVWSNKAGDVTVEYITSNHIAGHASYRINTPAGKVAVGGGASKDDGWSFVVSRASTRKKGRSESGERRRF